MGLREASVVLEEIHASGGNAAACHAQMYMMKWLELLRSAGVPASLINDVAELLYDDQMEACGMLIPTADQDAPHLKVIAPPLLFNGKRPLAARHPPKLGEHSRQILIEIGYSAAKLKELEEAGLLDGRTSMVGG